MTGPDFETVQPELSDLFPELVTALGGDPDALIAAVGEGPPSYRRHVLLLEAAAVALDCPDFGMRLAVRQGGLRSYGPLGLVMRHARTFGEALGYVADHIYAHSLAARIWLRPADDGAMVLSGHDILLGGIENRVQAVEQVLLVGDLGARELTGGRVRARRVHLRHQPVAAPRIYRRHFGCDVLFGQREDAVLFRADDMACPIATPDADAFRRAADRIETGFATTAPPVAALVRGLVMRTLGSERCTAAVAARELGLHPRTLHRRLAAEGTSFRAIRDAVRRESLGYYLRHTRLDLTAISEQLGFAEQSVLTRSCRRWFGRPPSVLRASGVMSASGAMADG